MLLREHDVILEGFTGKGAQVRLRPLTERDWPLPEKRNSDPEVLHYSEENDVQCGVLTRSAGYTGVSLSVLTASSSSITNTPVTARVVREARETTGRASWKGPK